MLIYLSIVIAAITLIVCYGITSMDQGNTQACPSISSCIAHSHVTSTVARVASCLSFTALALHYILFNSSSLLLLIAAASTIVCWSPHGSDQTEAMVRTTKAEATLHRAAACSLALLALIYMISVRSNDAHIALISAFALLGLCFGKIATTNQQCATFYKTKSLLGILEYFMLLVFTWLVVDAQISAQSYLID